ncbi:MAG: hypothetical protein OWU33_02270 [Firmicutes bacterium]|nr:hypothetical protein [Bacillota bacterium]
MSQGLLLRVTACKKLTVADARRARGRWCDNADDGDHVENAVRGRTLRR